MSSMPVASGSHSNHATSALSSTSLQVSNTTSNHFLGVSLRPWMGHTRSIVTAPNPSRPTKPHRTPASRRSQQDPALGRSAVGSTTATTHSSPIPSSLLIQSEAPMLSSSVTQPDAEERNEQPTHRRDSLNNAGISARTHNGVEGSSGKDMSNRPELVQDVHQVIGPRGFTSQQSISLQTNETLRFQVSAPGQSISEMASMNNPGRSPQTQPPPTTANIPTAVENVEGMRKRPRPNEANLAQETNKRRGGPRMSNDVAQVSAQLPTPQDSPTFSSAATLREQLDATINAQFDRRQYTVDMKPVIDGLRIEMLRDACRHNDIFYILTHSLYCLWYRDCTGHTDLTPTSAELVTLDKFNKFGLTLQHLRAMHVLRSILGQNDLLSHEMNEVFANFPMRPELFMAQASGPEPSLLDSVKCFFLCLPSSFNALKSNTLQRGYPPCPLEFKYALQLPSPVLLKAVHLSILRHLYTDQDWLRQATLLFEQELNAPVGNSLTIAELNAAQGAQLSAASQAFCQKYFQLLSQYSALRNRAPQPVPRAAGIYQLTRQQPSTNGQFHEAGQSQNQVAPVTQPFMFSSSTSDDRRSAPLNPSNVIGPRSALPQSDTGASESPVNGRATRGIRQVSVQRNKHPNPVSPPSPPRSQLSTTARISLVHTGTGPGPPQSVSSAGIQQNRVPPQVQPFIPRDHTHVLPWIAVPNPDRIALHQAHLRSPTFQKADNTDNDKSEVRYYQFVEELIELPQFLDANSGLVRWNVHVPHELWVRKANSLDPTGEFLSKSRKVWDGCVQFRLKCIVSDAVTVSPNALFSGFPVQSTKWPKCLSVSINGDMGVEFRRKAHHGVDLATDVTDLLKEGDNEVIVCINFTAGESHVAYLFAVEVICVADHKRVLSMPRPIGAEEALSAITTALKSKHDGKDDDELIISQPLMSIDIIDPITSLIWVVPVRGKQCRHRECFDLEAFLLSRTSYVKKSGLTSPDQWKCPICREDARPQMLVIDGFLQTVRKTLEETNKLDTKAILVKEDGSWETKADPLVSRPQSEAKAESGAANSEDASRGNYDETPGYGTTSSTAIVLDDDD
ncbi:uncharacterized protein Z518_02316 [Rhinocladiella mackenziei CBS 650.93]|uniref:SP-RING-type domain-containing protein n=1 Tax=Rhinocladiella mackenziei CBS 650.93 TaxID=1442369 RepID=A0A0D2HB49_9EURO|nr:uncharacterized protein Z518_02316 [Rhinocladiella mackenziei CBS 650.93]KIX07663.1 hypothetical protein Z518_02316 [Rhinocladiella mackenziei CBS 650.93]